MKIKVFQANVNRSKPSLDLLIHQAKEFGTGLLLILEPNYVPDSANWFASQNNGAAIFVDTNLVRMSRLVIRASRFVAIRCGKYMIISVYTSPSIGLVEFNVLLDELSGTISSRVNKILLAGDFNAKASARGSRSTDQGGRLLTKWAAERDLRIANVGQVSTCVSTQGSSIIDLTWVSPDLLSLIKAWRVREELESLSDHCYISFEVDTSRPRLPSNRTCLRKWNTKKFDKDLFQGSLISRGGNPTMEDPINVTQVAEWLDQAMEEAYDMAASRIDPQRPRRCAYWWHDSAAILRRQCIQARRQWQRAKKKRRAPEMIEELGTR